MICYHNNYRQIQYHQNECYSIILRFKDSDSDHSGNSGKVAICISGMLLLNDGTWNVLSAALVDFWIGLLYHLKISRSFLLYYSINHPIIHILFFIHILYFIHILCFIILLLLLLISSIIIIHTLTYVLCNL